MLNETIVDKLSVITDEEHAILNGSSDIDRSIYMEQDRDVVSGKKLLSPNKLIAVRPHTRFVHFPEHSHDYVEMVYMCRGSTTHIINDIQIELRSGELLLLSQNARQEILPAGENDLAVNFIIRPEFFGATLSYLGDEETPLRKFVLDCLCGENDASFLHFKVSGILPIENLVENLLWTLITDTPNRRGINQATMGLLFMQLLNHTDKLRVPNRGQELVLHVLRYVEEHYRDGSLREIAAFLHYDEAWLSREIKRKIGKNFTELVQEKRLSQALWLLRNTDKKVDDVALAVGYENISYFHRIFAKHFGASPKKLRNK